MNKPTKKTRLHSLVREVLALTDYELVLLEWVKEGGMRILRVLIDHGSGIGHEDCERVSHLLSERLDQEDPIVEAYQLEVSSPGVDRPLVTPEHFLRFIGSRVWIKLYKAVEGYKAITGILLSFEGETLMVQVENGPTLAIAFDNLARATLKPHLTFS
jgi:ribosome maturation factor RimP